MKHMRVAAALGLASMTTPCLAADYGLYVAAFANAFNLPGDSEIYRERNADTAHTVEAHVAQALAPYPTSIADAFASANLATGELKASGSGNLACIGTACISAGGTGIAEFSETLIFDIPGATNQTVTPLTMTFSSIGSLTPGRSPGDLNYSFQGRFGDSPGGLNSDFFVAFQNGQLTYGASDFASVAFTSTEAENFGIVVTYNLRGARPTMVSLMNLSAGGGNGGSADFSHTARVGFTLPAGVTFTSASGVFLTQAAGAVPEPAIWAMMIGGFGVIGGAMRARVRPGIAVAG